MKKLILILLVLIHTATYGQRVVGGGTQAVIGVTQQTLNDTATALRNNIPADVVTNTILNDSMTVLRNEYTAPPIKQNIGGLYSDGFNVGDLVAKYPGYTYNQIKAIRQNNFTIFKTLCDSSKVYDIPVLLPAGKLEIHINSGQKITVRDSAELVIKGQKTIVECWPLVKSYAIVLFDLDDDYRQVNNTLKLYDVEFTTIPFKYDTYNVTLKPSGVANQITITDSYINASTLAKLTAGQTIVVNYSPTQIGYDHTISSYNAGTKTITLTANLNGIITNNDAGYIGIAFNEDTNRDTILTRGKDWLEDNVFWTFIESIYGYDNNDKPVTITLDKVSVTGFDTGISVSNMSGKIKITDSYISCHSLAISCYSSNTFLRDYFVEMYDSKFIDNGFIVYAYGAGVGITADNVYGSGTYFHPNIVCIVDGCIFDNIAVNFRNYSAGGAADNIADPKWVTLISNSVFKETYDIYNCMLSQVIPAVVTGCSFEGGNVYGNLKTTFQGCHFRNTDLVAGAFNGAETRIDNCYFYESAIQADNDTQPVTNKVYISDSKFYPLDGSTRPTFDFANAGYIEFNNCEIEGRDLNANYALFGGLTMPQKVVLNNCIIGAFTAWPYLFTRADYINTNIRPRVEFNKCELSTCPIRGNSNTPEQIFVYNECTFTDAFLYTYYNVDLAYEGKLKKQVNTTNQIHTSQGGVQSWVLNPNYNTFKLSGLTGKRAYFDKRVTLVVSDVVNVIAGDSLIITKFNSSSNTTSNFMFSGNFSKDEAFAMFWDPFTFLYSGSTIVTDTLGTVNGTQNYFRSHTVGTTATSNQLIPGTITITVSGQTFTDDGKGNLYKNGVYAGYIDYQRDTVNIGFSVIPAAGNVVLTYSKWTTIYSVGCWRRL